MTEEEMKAKLFAPFSVMATSFRPGSTTKDKSKGMGLAYIDARDVEKRLDIACGIFGWQCNYELAATGGKVTCNIGILFDGVWVWKANGAGDTNVEGDKGSYSDAFKRAATKWGIGRYLYKCPSWWVEIDQYKRFTDNGQKQLQNNLQVWINTWHKPLEKAA